MTDSTNLTEAPMPEQSTELDGARPADPALAQRKEPEDEKPQSRMDALKRADADLAAKERPKEEPKEPEVKEEPKEPATKADPKEEPKEALKEQPREAEAREKPDRPEPKGAEAPKEFLPRAKELWVNTPRAVQDEVARLTREYETEREQTRAATERYEAIRPFDELAKSNGRDLRESLVRLNEIENLMERSPLAGLNAILMEIGPTKPDGQKVSLYEIAHHIVQQGPQGYQQMMAQAQQRPAQQQGDPRVAHLEAQLASLQQQQVAMSIIEPFKREHPRYDELQHDIAFFLESGKVPASLSPYDRLATAYDMAERINPVSSHGTAAYEGLEPERRVDTNSSGSKSIKGAPSSGLSPQTGRRGKLSRREALDAAYSELGLN